MSPNDEDFDARIAGGGPPGDLHGRLKPHFAALRARMDARDLLRATQPAFRAARWAAMAAMAALAALATLTLWPAAPPTWAEVVEEFATMPHVHATFYVEQTPGAPAERVDLWMARGGRLRIKAGERVWLGAGGRVTRGFTDGEPGQAQPEGAAQTVLEITRSIGEAESFSFETILRALPPGGAFRPARPQPGQATPSDLVVFDFHHPDGSDTRVWALRSGRVPVRTLYVNAGSGERVDVVLDYAEPPAPSFFESPPLAGGNGSAASR